VWDSGFSVADFVAVHSCEGSGGIAPLFPHTSAASGYQRENAKNPQDSLQSSLSKHYDFQLMEGPFTLQTGLSNGGSDE
jgi:hypothetical protein